MRTLFALSLCWSLGCGGTKSGNGADSGPGGGADARARADAAPRADGNPMVSKAHPHIYLTTENPIGAANRTRLETALSSGSAAATRFKDMVDQEMTGADWYNFSPWFAALLGQLTGTTSYCDYAIGLVDTDVAAEEALISSGARPNIAGDDYYGFQDMIAEVMLTYDWCFDRVSSTQKTRWLAYASQAVYNVWNPNDATWGGTPYTWTGWGTTDPGDNYYYNFLRGTMYFGLGASGDDPTADQWINYFRKDKLDGMLFPLMNSLVGGGSAEETGYGVSMGNLFEIYDWWYRSTGERVDDITPHTLASLRHYLHLIVPTLDYEAPTGDHSRDSTGALFDYDRNYMLVLTNLYDTDPIAPYAKWMLENCSVRQMSQGFMYVSEFLYDDPSVTAAPSLDALGPAYYAQGIGQLYARSSWATDATWLNFIAGAYTESHAHQDQGSLTVYKGAYLAYDPVIDSHSGLPQATEFHNLVRFESGGQSVTQQVGAPMNDQLLALHDEAAYTYMSADLTNVYNGNSAVDKSQREVVFVKPDLIFVFDRADGSATRKVWQLNSPTLPTVTGSQVEIVNGSSQLDIYSVYPTGATPIATDWYTLNPPLVTAGISYDMDFPMNQGYRTDIASTDPMARFLTVLSLDGAAITVAQASSSAGLGADVTLADGSHVVVTFNDTTTGGSISWQTSGGTVTSQATLADGVDTLPFFAP
jgi:hypothetical protein